MTSSNGNIFRVTGHLCGEFIGLRWIPHTKASDAELYVFFDLRLNKRLTPILWLLARLTLFSTATEKKKGGGAKFYISPQSIKKWGINSTFSPHILTFWKMGA